MGSGQEHTRTIDHDEGHAEKQKAGRSMPRQLATSVHEVLSMNGAKAHKGGQPISGGERRGNSYITHGGAACASCSEAGSFHPFKCVRPVYRNL